MPISLDPARPARVPADRRPPASSHSLRHAAGRRAAPIVSRSCQPARVARGTVEAAYAILAGEGRPPVSRFRRNGGLPAHRPHGGSQPQCAPRGCPSETHTPQRVPAFRMGLPALDAFPRKLWTRLAAREIRRNRRRMNLAYPDPAGHRPLREMISQLSRPQPGHHGSPEQVWVTGGFQGALSLIISAVLRPGDAVWVEDPGYPPARDALLAARARLMPVPVDGHGMKVDTAIEQAPKARLALLTPTHQSPLGVTLSLERRLSYWRGQRSPTPGYWKMITTVSFATWVIRCRH